MSDRITAKIIETAIIDLSSITCMTYTYTQNMVWHNLDVIGIHGAHYRIISCDNKKDFYNAIIAIKAHYYAMLNLGKIAV
jgi:hypothetical protein